MSRLIDWLIDELRGRLINWLIDWLIDWRVFNLFHPIGFFSRSHRQIALKENFSGTDLHYSGTRILRLFTDGFSVLTEDIFFVSHQVVSAKWQVKRACSIYHWLFGCCHLFDFLFFIIIFLSPQAGRVHIASMVERNIDLTYDASTFSLLLSFPRSLLSPLHHCTTWKTRMWMQRSVINYYLLKIRPVRYVCSLRQTRCADVIWRIQRKIPFSVNAFFHHSHISLSSWLGRRKEKEDVTGEP